VSVSDALFDVVASADDDIRVASPAALVADLSAGVLTLTLNRPERRNALNRELCELLLAAIQDAQVSPRVRVIVLTGAGSAFCAGDDIATLDDHLAGETSAVPSVRETGDAYYLRIIEALLSCGKPVIAALNGPSAGAGTELACASDIRIASDRARIGSCLINVAQVGNAVMLPRVVGPSAATELYLSGRLVDAEEALSLGLVHRVVAHDRFRAEVSALAADLAAKPTRAIALYKELRERVISQPVELGLRLQDRYHVRNNLEIEDAVEGARAFIEKRPPRFTGR
jgi:enoyl-CoA hydratase/carnithine racemase